MSTVVASSPRRHATYAHIDTLPLQHGGELRDVRIACETFGPVDALPVLVLGGISAGRHLVHADARPGWWRGVVGAGGALDPAQLRLIGIDYLGGRGASSRPYARVAWPALSTYDQAAAVVAVLDALGIERLHAVVGASLGGKIALALVARYPERVECVITFGAAHRSHPLATAIRSVQRRIIRLGLDHGAGAEAVAAARALAMTTYRTAPEFRERFAGAPTIDERGVRFPVDAYLDHHGGQYADTFDAESYLTISQCLDLHDVDPALIRATCHLACFDTDTLVPPQDVRALACALGERASLTCIPTVYGHDGFLKEVAAVNAVIRSALTNTAARAPALAGAPPPPLPDGTPATHYAARATGLAAQPNAWATTARAGAGEWSPACSLVTTATAAVRAGIGSDTQHGAVIAPVYLSSTFSFDGLGGKRAYDYTRSGNPTRDVLAATIAELEGGAAGIVTATGMAAITVVLQLLQPGELLIAAHDGYGGTYRLLRTLARKHAFDVAFVDLTDARAQEVIRTRRPRMVWVETPSNPLLRITDIAAVARAAHDASALCVVDNTFLSPALQTPIALGADIVVHSTTKYLNGHSDVVGGAIVARDHALAEEIGWWANCIGATGSPFDSFLTLRGVRTLHARIRVHEENTHALVELLHGHPAVQAVHYPGLPTHPGHSTARGQQRGFGAMVSFELSGGMREVERLVAGLRCFTLAESLGGVESLIAHPATMTHAAMDAAARRAAGIGDTLLRLSVGIESCADLVADLRSALTGRRAGA